jgi:CheY-like chemotaxis protein
LLTLDPKTAQALAPSLGRVLIVDPAPGSARLLSDLLHNVGPGRVWTATSTAQGLALADSLSPQVIFVEYLNGAVDGLAFTRKLRRSTFLCRKAPVIMATTQATPAAILGARDAGAHEFLRKPFTFKDLVRRLEAVALHPRGWVEAVGYVGPDRRRFNSAAYAGRRKRRTDEAQSPEQARIGQALKIISAALPMAELDRQQTFRALKAQAIELQSAGSAVGDVALVQAARMLHATLSEIGSPQALTRSAVEADAQRLLGLQPASSKPSRSPAAA